MENYQCIFGVSTEQNITNLIPVIQSGVKRCQIINTSRANKSGWSDGLEKVLKTKGFEFFPILLEEKEDTRIDLIIEKLHEKLDENPVIWNLGGGQKAQQLAFWSTFLKRTSQHIEDRACYLNPEKHILEWWGFTNGKLAYSCEHVNCDINMENILMLYGFEKHSGECLYSKNQYINCQKYPDLLLFSEFREFLYRLPNQSDSGDENSDIGKLIENYIEKGKKELSQKIYSYLEKLVPEERKVIYASGSNLQGYSNGIVNQFKKAFQKFRIDGLPKKDIQVENVELKAKLQELDCKKIDVLTPIPETLKMITKIEKAADYFEKIVIQRTKDMLENQDHCILEALYNVKVKNSNSCSIIAEYDILLLTQWGTLIAIDAKTYDFPKKEQDARLYNLQKFGGKYVNFIPVIPYHLEDLEKDYMPKNLKTLPERLTTRKTKFFVIADGIDKEFTISKEEKTSHVDIGSIRCVIFNHFLNELKLSYS